MKLSKGLFCCPKRTFLKNNIRNSTDTCLENEESHSNLKNLNYLQLFRYANVLDLFLLLIALVSCIAKSFLYPCSIIFYGELVAMLVDRNLGIGTTSKTIMLPLFNGGQILTNATKEENMAELRNDAWAFGGLLTITSLGTFFSGIIYVDILNHVSLRIIAKLRREFFKATVRKDIGWHDVSNGKSFATQVTDDMEKIRAGISENLGHFLNLTFTTIISIILSFIYGWKLTLVISVFTPFSLLCSNILAKYQRRLAIREQTFYARAGSLFEEIIGAVRTVVAYGGEKKESERYDELLISAEKVCKRKGVFSGVGDSIETSLLYFQAAGLFWYGVKLLLDDRAKTDPEYTPAVLIIVYFGILVATDQIARCSPFIDSITKAVASAVPIYEVIDSGTRIDPMSSDGKILNSELKGNIEFKDIFFRYPSRKDIVVLRGLNFKVSAGQTVALVGPSGCGKSTCLQLLQRFYNADFGNIILDDLDITQYNVKWLRSNIAVVGQEPVLFQGTIGENIRHGNPNATQKDIENAARKAGAHDFIVNFPKSYDTFVNEKGVQLSGGQKQRIAIARALIQNPKILLLDEATSALDYYSEKLVQKALSAASKNRTTIVVSHRLSAIKEADKIFFIYSGKIVEEGSHEDLINLRGKYFEMLSGYESNNNDEDQGSDLQKGNSIDIILNQTNTVMEKNHLKKNSFSSVSNISRTSNIKENQQELNETQFLQTFFRIICVARKEWGLLFLGTVCAIAVGCAHPVYGILFGDFFASIGETNKENILNSMTFLGCTSTFIGFIVAAAFYTQSYFFNLAGVRVTTRLRSLTLKSILAQEISWFDDEENSVGALSARLSGDAACIQGAIGKPLSNLIQAGALFVCSISLAFSFSWQMALACLCTSPFMIGSVVFEARYMENIENYEKKILEKTCRIATEAITNIRTVAALRRESQLIEEYNKEVEKNIANLRKRLRYRGTVNSFGWAIMFFGYALALTYGTILCSEGRLEYQNIIKVSECLLYGLMVLAVSLAFAPSFTTAIISSNRLLKIIDKKPDICTSFHSKNNVAVDNSLKGVTYKDVSFRYPSRPDVLVLNNLNLMVLQGKTIALVGASGCGKSTCIQLLLRYYSPERGSIYLDGKDIERNFTTTTLRRQLGIVSQEPTLFEKTIAENIAFGDNFRDVPMADIVEAAKKANAHNFITSLPKGYETKLGAKGTQLSGGQKQRIAIARALIRNPQILLLDEATSALDLRNERIVQAALDKTCSGRTCIVVAHRLSTVQNADLICVFQNGRIAEQGNHLQLLSRGDIYAKLYKSQSEGDFTK